MGDSSTAIETVEMHTAGEPVRIVVAGLPRLEGRTLLEKRNYAATHVDHIRQRLMREPRGHHEMYGVYVLEADLPEAHFAVLFLHNEGYSTMCGHATIAVARWAVESGRVPRATGGAAETEVAIQCPCGLVRAHVRGDGSVWFRSVPSFVLALDREIALDDGNKVVVDVSFGGAFYAILPAQRVGLDLATAPVAHIVDAAHRTTKAVQAQMTITHPFEPDLSFLYGTILTDGGDGSQTPSMNVCVFADRQVDRSPTGSGVQARLAIEAARAQLRHSAVLPSGRFESITKQVFDGAVLERTTFGPHDAVTVSVAGKGYFTGRCFFTVEESDPLKDGFLLH